MPPASSSPHSLALLYRSPEEKQSRVSRRFRSFFERRSNPKNGHICICRLYDSALNGVCATSPSFNDNHHLYLQSSNDNMQYERFFPSVGNGNGGRSPSFLCITSRPSVNIRYNKKWHVFFPQPEKPGRDEKKTYQLDNRVNDNEDWASYGFLYDYIWNKIFKTNIDKYILFVFWFISLILIFLFDFQMQFWGTKTYFRIVKLNLMWYKCDIIKFTVSKKVQTQNNQNVVVKNPLRKAALQNLNLRLRMMIMFRKAQHIFQM